MMAPQNLVLQAARGSLPTHQLMDRATVEWIRTNRPSVAAAPVPLPAATERALLRRSAIPRHWYPGPRAYESIHGVRHGMRVAALGAVLAGIRGLPPEETAAVIVAGAVHDCRRHNDRADRGHGRRAARWLARHQDEVLRHFRWQTGIEQFDRAVAAVGLHDVSYHEFTPAERRAYWAAREVTDLLKAADALDRFRLPRLRWWPDTGQVREPAFDRVRSFAFDLVLASESDWVSGAGSTEAVLRAFTTRGLV